MKKVENNSDEVERFFVVAENWRFEKSGVYTFVRMMLLAMGSNRLRAIEYPVAVDEKEVCADQHDRESARRSPPHSQWVMSWRLLAGYLQMLIREIRADMRLLHDLPRGSVLVLNDFGAEVRPIAFRLLCPLSRIISISHTHPNLHIDDSWVRKLIEILCFWSCSRVVFNSYALMVMWEQKLGRNIGKGVVVHHGMALPDEMILPASYPEKMLRTVDVVCVGLFYLWKGQLALIDAWQEVVQRCKVPLRLIFVGGGACLEVAQARVKELGLDQEVVFLGQQPDGAEFFNGADIAIHYPVEPEAFGLVLLEAMARGKPVIAPAHGGATEIVVDGETGYLVKPKVESRKQKWESGNGGGGTTKTLRHEGELGVMSGEWRVEGGTTESLKPNVQSLTSETEDRRSLVEAVCRLAEDAELRKRMGDAGRERVRTEFSVERMLAGYDEVFNSLVS